jgi:hypothetical protein
MGTADAVSPPMKTRSWAALGALVISGCAGTDGKYVSDDVVPAYGTAATVVPTTDAGPPPASSSATPVPSTPPPSPTATAQPTPQKDEQHKKGKHDKDDDD